MGGACPHIYPPTIIIIIIIIIFVIIIIINHYHHRAQIWLNLQGQGSSCPSHLHKCCQKPLKSRLSVFSASYNNTSSSSQSLTKQALFTIQGIYEDKGEASVGWMRRPCWKWRLWMICKRILFLDCSLYATPCQTPLYSLLAQKNKLASLEATLFWNSVSPTDGGEV